MENKKHQKNTFDVAGVMFDSNHPCSLIRKAKKHQFTEQKITSSILLQVKCEVIEKIHREHSTGDVKQFSFLSGECRMTGASAEM